MSLDDIWDEPIVASPPRASPTDDPDAAVRPTPAKRRRTTLFLSSDSEEENPSQTKPQFIPNAPHTPERKRPDIEALFDDIDDDLFQDLAPALDVDQLRSQIAAGLPPLTPHAILTSSSPPRDLGPADGEGGNGQGSKEKGKDGLHKRRKIPALDDERLLGPDGFPALVKQAKHFKPRGKGHEVCKPATSRVATHNSRADTALRPQPPHAGVAVLVTQNVPAADVPCQRADYRETLPLAADDRMYRALYGFHASHTSCAHVERAGCLARRVQGSHSRPQTRGFAG